MRLLKSRAKQVISGLKTIYTFYYEKLKKKKKPFIEILMISCLIYIGHF